MISVQALDSYRRFAAFAVLPNAGAACGGRDKPEQQGNNPNKTTQHDNPSGSTLFVRLVEGCDRRKSRLRWLSLNTGKQEIGDCERHVHGGRLTITSQILDPFLDVSLEH